MSDPDWSNVSRIHVDRIASVQETLKSGGGGGTYDGMEQRVSRLEDRLDKMTDRIGAVEVNLAILTERVSHLPGKDFIVKVVVSSLAIFGALSLFSDQIKAFLHIG